MEPGVPVHYPEQQLETGESFPPVFRLVSAVPHSVNFDQLATAVNAVDECQSVTGY